MKVEQLGKVFKPGNPMHQDFISMGQNIGFADNTRFTALYGYDNKTFKIVDTKTGDTIRVTAD